MDHFHPPDKYNSGQLSLDPSWQKVSEHKIRNQFSDSKDVECLPWHEFDHPGALPSRGTPDGEQPQEQNRFIPATAVTNEDSVHDDSVESLQDCIVPLDSWYDCVLSWFLFMS